MLQSWVLNHVLLEQTNAGLFAPVVSSWAIAIIHFNKKRKSEIDRRYIVHCKEDAFYISAYTPPGTRKWFLSHLSSDTIAAPRHWTDVRFIWVSMTCSSSICQWGRITFTSAGFTAFFIFTHTRTRLPAEAAAAKSIRRVYLLYTNNNTNRW